MQSPSGKRVDLHRCQPGSSRCVHLTRLRQTIVFARLHLTHRLNLLKRGGGKFNSLVLRLLPAPGLLVSPLATVPTLRQRNESLLSGHFYSLDPYLACLCLFPLPFLCLLLHPFSDTFHLPCHEPRAAQIAMGSQCQRPFSHVRAQGWVSLTARTTFKRSRWAAGACYITVATWTVCWRSATAANTYCATSFSQEASMSPRPRPSMCIFFHLARGLRIPLKSAAVRFPPSPSYSSLSTRHASNPKRRGTKETRDSALPSHFVLNKA